MRRVNIQMTYCFHKFYECKEIIEGWRYMMIKVLLKITFLVFLFPVMVIYNLVKSA